MLRNAQVDSSYSVWVGYKTSSSGCDGSWNSLGQIHVTQNGNADFVGTYTLSLDRQYIIALEDQSGNTIFATPFITT
jgi:hypothetical protein